MKTSCIELSKKSFLVGGAVRDQLLGLQAKDKDFVVVGSSVKEMLAAGFKSVGSDFPVFLHPTTHEEYALARTERKSGRGYTGFSVDVSEAVTLEQDLARRDITINSMALDNNGDLIDPYQGFDDLQNKVLRHTTNAFIEDPVRVLRVARFLARFGPDWVIHEDTKNLFVEMKRSGELDFLTPERVWKETERALGEEHPELFFDALDGLGLFPEIESMHDVPQPVAHHPEGDVFQHTMLCIKRAAKLNLDTLTRFACLTHDFGKPLSYVQLGNLHGHEKAGIEVIEKFCERLRVPNDYKKLALLTSQFHLHIHKIKELKPGTIQKMIVKHFNAVKQPQVFEQFIMACQCDAQGRGPERENKRYEQGDLARKILINLQKLDTKTIVADAIKKGKQGKVLGDMVEAEQINIITQTLKLID